MIAKAKRVLWRKLNPIKLIVHIGLHKTGSTYLQHILNENSDNLQKRGVYYQRQEGYPAHHRLAWRILLNEHEPLVWLIDEARNANCDTLILSSEDLEGILYDDRPLEAIQRAAIQGGVSEIEYHVVLREPGAAFASLYKELAKHTYVDLLALVHSVVRRGFIHMAEPGGGVPYWYYSFDHARDLKNFARRSGCKPIIHDFKNMEPFPGWQVIANHIDSIKFIAGDNAMNKSHSLDKTAELFQEHLSQIGIMDPVKIDNLEKFSLKVSKEFADSHAEALTL